MEDVKNKIKKNQINFKKDIQPEIKKWIVKMLNVYPKHRPHVKDILADSFFGKFRAEIESKSTSNMTTTTTTSSGYTRPTKANSSNLKVISLNSLKSIKEQDSAKNSVNNSLNNNKQYQLSNEPTSIHSNQSNSQKIFRFETFKNEEHSHGSANVIKRVFSKDNSVGQSPQKPRNIFYDHDFNNSQKLKQFNQSTGLTSNGKKVFSTFTKSTEVRPFQKKKNTETVQVNEIPSKGAGLKFMGSKTTEEPKEQTTPQSKKFTALRNKIMQSKPKKVTLTKFKAKNGISNIKSINKSPATFANKSKVQYHSEHKPVSSFKWSSNTMHATTTPVTAQKWGAKKFTSTSSFQNSRLGTKLITRNNNNNSNNNSINSNASSTLRNSENTKQLGVQRVGLSSNNNNHNGMKWKMTKLSAPREKTNLVSVSRGQFQTGVSRQAFNSVRNPGKFSSSFQNRNYFSSTQHIPTSTRDSAPSGNKNGIQGNLVKPATQMNFLKKKQAENLVRFLQPKIIKKQINPSKSFKSTKVIGSFKSSGSGLRNGNFGKKVQPVVFKRE